MIMRTLVNYHLFNGSWREERRNRGSEGAREQVVDKGVDKWKRRGGRK